MKTPKPEYTMFRVEFECDNDAFAVKPEYETAAILRRIADKIERESLFANSAQWVRDTNGNRVGTYKYEVR